MGRYFGRGVSASSQNSALFTLTLVSVPGKLIFLGLRVVLLLVVHMCQEGSSLLGAYLKCLYNHSSFTLQLYCHLTLGFKISFCPTGACGFQIWSLSSPSERVSLGSVNIWYSHHVVFIIIHPELKISKTSDTFFFPFVLSEKV